MLLQRLKNKIFKAQLGLLPVPKDERDLKLGLLWFGTYQPKHDKLLLEPLTVKTQTANTCGWASTTGAKEIDEGVELSTRSLVIFGKRAGYISGDGFSNLRDNEKVLQKYGIAEKRLLVENSVNWEDYSNLKYLNDEIIRNAETHKSKTYFSVNNVDEVYKALDDRRPVRIGLPWYSGLNMGGGFKAPWFWRIIGYFIGYHAMYIYGYDMNYQGQKVFYIRNSFGEGYGDKGDLYITPNNLQPYLVTVGSYVNYDVDVDLAKWFVQHQNKIVKSHDNQNVFLITGTEKRKFKDLATLYSWGYLDSDIIIVPGEYLDKVKEGESLSFWEGKNVQAIKAILLQKKELKNIFVNYFSELF